jgi:hypothetical protein
MKRFLLIAVVSIAVLRADPAPALTWTSDAVSVSGVVSTTSTGMIAFGSCLGCGFAFFADRTFTVTSPGTFVLSTVISLDGDSTNCRIFSFCLPFARFVGEIDGETNVGTDIFFGGPNSQHFADSGSDTVDCGADDAQCLAIFDLEDHRSNSIILGLGDYILFENYTGFGGGADPFFRYSIDASLVPTPEPKGGIIVAGALLVAVSLKVTRGGFLNSALSAHRKTSSHN